MRKLFPMMAVLVAAILVAGCDESPTNGVPTPTPPVSFAITGVQVEGRSVTFTLTGPATMKIVADVRCCSSEDGACAGFGGLVEVPPGTYTITVPVRQDGHNIDVICGGPCGLIHAQPVGRDSVEVAVCWAAAP